MIPIGSESENYDVQQQVFRVFVAVCVCTDIVPRYSSLIADSDDPSLSQTPPPVGVATTDLLAVDGLVRECITGDVIALVFCRVRARLLQLPDYHHHQQQPESAEAVDAERVRRRDLKKVK